jgi:hypothetical protein
MDSLRRSLTQIFAAKNAGANKNDAVLTLYGVIACDKRYITVLNNLLRGSGCKVTRNPTYGIDTINVMREIAKNPEYRNIVENFAEQLLDA